MGIRDDLLHLATHDVTAQNGTVTGTGEWSASGAAVTLRSRVEIGPRTVRDSSGQERVASGLIVSLDTLSHRDARLWRFTLPATFGVAAERIAIRIDAVPDRTGSVIAEEIYLA